DAERQRDDDGERERLRAAQRPQRDPDVLPERFGAFDQAWTPDRAHGVAHQRGVAELAQRRVARLLRVFAALDALADREGDVSANLVVEIVQVWPHGHSAGFMIRPMALTSRDQRSRS